MQVNSRLLTEKILRNYLGIHDIFIHAISHAECCHQGNVKPARGLLNLFEQLPPLADIIRICFLDNERANRELHLAEVDNVVSTCN